MRGFVVLSVAVVRREQIGDGEVEGRGELLGGREGDVALGALDGPDNGPVQPGERREVSTF